MFSFQANNTTRVVEYPWAFFAAGLEKGMDVTEIGGGLAGFQFVLSRFGCRVVNVDPGLEARGRGWDVDQRGVGRLNRAFGTSVELRNTTLQETDLARSSMDRVFAISTLEHVPADETGSLVARVRDILRPGGLFICTIDLFLNLEPFSARPSNDYGRNVDIRELVAQSGLHLVAGEPSELCGYEEFDARAILARLEEFWVGRYPCVAQTLVLEKK